MKKVLVLLTLLSVFISSCQKERKSLVETINENKITSENLDISVSQFHNILNGNMESVTDFSNFINTIKITEYSNIVREDNKINFEISSEKIFVNGSLVEINNSIFSIEYIDGNYIISNSNIDLSIKYETTNNNFYIETLETSKNYEDVTETDIENDENLKYSPIFMAVLEDLVMPEKNNNRKPTIVPVKYEGTGLGFHKDRASAEKFCNSDKDKILKANPGWCSPGVSISCVWDNHICICTAEFYSGKDC